MSKLAVEASPLIYERPRHSEILQLVLTVESHDPDPNAEHIYKMIAEYLEELDLIVTKVEIKKG